MVHDSWKLIATACGLSPSVGKYYFDDSFLEMNSTQFQYLPSMRYELEEFLPKSFVKICTGTNCFRRVPYVNFGILKCLPRSAAGNTPKSVVESLLLSADTQQSDLFEDCPDYLWDQVNATFLRNLSKELREHKVSIPYYLPKHYGGLGLMPSRGYGPSRNDLQWVAFANRYPNWLKRIKMLNPDAKWLLAKAAGARLNINQADMVLQEDSDFDSLVSSMNCGLLFRRKDNLINGTYFGQVYSIRDTENEKIIFSDETPSGESFLNILKDVRSNLKVMNAGKRSASDADTSASFLSHKPLLTRFSEQEHGQLF